MNAAFEHGVERLVFLGSSCIYPKMAPQPIIEESLLSGPLEETNSAYTVAKISGIELVKSYRREYGCSWISLMPTKLYALIHRFVKAIDEKAKEVVLWGTGLPRREFMHVDDAARAIILALDHYDAEIPLNIGVGWDISIKELAETISDATGFRGEISWDSSKPDGVPRKVLDVSRLKALGFEPRVALKEGLQSTIAFFRGNKGRIL
jgi:GDP-L-fucose synthase